MVNEAGLTEFEKSKIYRTEYYAKNRAKIQKYQREYYRKYVKKNEKKSRGFAWRGEKMVGLKITHLKEPIILEFL